MFSLQKKATTLYETPPKGQTVANYSLVQKMTDAICEATQASAHSSNGPASLQYYKKINMPYCVERGKPRATEHPKKDRHI